MIAVLATSPVTMPSVPTVAFAGAEELHVPPVTASLNAALPPAQTEAMPAIGPGAGFTVTIAVAVQPALNE